jgi:hypothetical protein
VKYFNKYLWPGTAWNLNSSVFFFVLFCLFVFFFFFFFFFRDRVSRYRSGCPGTHFVDQAGLELRNLPATASRVLELKACATTPGSSSLRWKFLFFFFNQQPGIFDAQLLSAG